MTDAIDDLTEKEKETLRLIVRGHDAKSAAIALDLSVHTINERLRAARRKLDVTSSREAARVLLDSEQASPENLVYEALGDAPGAPYPDVPPIPKPGRNPALWIGGIVLMLTLAIALTASLSTTPAEVPAPQETQTITISQTTDNADAEREAAARAWLALVDKSDWEASYAAAGKAFRDPNTVATWQGASEAARVPLGNVIKREAVEFQYVAAPPKGYELVRFRSQFANRDEVIETVTLERESDGLRVVGYFIN